MEVNETTNYYRDGKVATISTKLSNGQLQSFNDKPALIFYNHDEDYGYFLYLKEWCKEDVIHRLTGPAKIFYKWNGEIEEEEYYLNDIYYNKQDWEVQINRLEMLNEIE